MGNAELMYSALAAVSLVIALILAAAWQEFGHVPHARTWAAGFALLAAMAVVELCRTIGAGAALGPSPEMLVLGGFASAANTVGFRQRAGLPPRFGMLFGAAAAQGILASLLASAGFAPLVCAAPLNLFNMAMFGLGAATLTGRRKGERIAERAAQTTLLVLAAGSLAVATLALGAPEGWLRLPARLLLLAVPALVTGVGLFTIFVIAADLADKVRRQAGTDMLTGLLNRRGFEDAAAAIFASAHRHGRSMAIAIADIDHFKRINDRFGHPAGDRVLQRFAQCLQAGVARRDLVARIGGEEFAILLADVDGQAAACSIEVMRERVATLELGLAEPLSFSASFGVAALADGELDLAALLERADRALYQSKAEGRDRVSLFTGN